MEILARASMMSLQRAGFFRELRHGSHAGPSLRGQIQQAGPIEEGLIVRYLENGAVLAATGSLVDDMLDPRNRGIARLEIVTDGRWVWPRDLAYYVQNYHVRLPSGFVEHMRQNGWQPPDLPKGDLVRLGEEFVSDG